MTIYIIRAMKNLLKNSLSGYALAFSLAVLQIGCSEKKTASNENNNAGESDAAYTDYKNYVSSLDTTAIASTDTASGHWNQQRAMYDEKVARLDQYTNDYDEPRRQEIDQLKSRYNSYWNSHASIRSGGMAPDKVSTTGATGSVKVKSVFDPATINANTPMAIRQAYEKFVADVQAHKDHFTKEDWQQVAAYNQALDDRKNSMQSQLSDKDKYEIGKAKAKYTALKAGEKLDPDVSKAASDVKETGKDVGEAGSKVGHAAKETGKDVKDATVKGAKAVGNTAKKAGQKVGDALDDDKDQQ